MYDFIHGQSIFFDTFHRHLFTFEGNVMDKILGHLTYSLFNMALKREKELF